MTEGGFDIIPSEHPIVAILFGKYHNCTKLAVNFAKQKLEEGIYVIAFSYPGSSRGKDRYPRPDLCRTQFEQIDTAITAFSKVARELGMFK